MDIKKMYEEKKCTAEEALELIKDKDCMYAAQAASEPQAILSHLDHLKKTGVKDTILTTCLPLAKHPVFHDPEMVGIMKHNGWFLNADLRKAHEERLCHVVPQRSCVILDATMERNRREGRRDVVLATASPMDEHGYLSLSISAIYEKDLIDRGALTILEVNPNYPRTFGDTQVHISQVAALVESDRPVPEAPILPYPEIDAKIGKYIADLIEDGSTIQLGIGYIPNAVAHELKSKKHLGIHTEMITETMVDLIECGAVDNSQKGLLNGYTVGSFAMGSKKLYNFLENNPTVLFKSCTFTNNPWVIAQNKKFVSINASLEIDLMGQCASESIGPVQYSGTGGQSETVMGARMSEGGKSIIAMHSTYSTKDENGKEVLHSKIVPMLKQGSVVSTSRNDVDYVVTEYGVAWLAGANLEDRVKALIAIAHPDFREELARQAEELKFW